MRIRGDVLSRDGKSVAQANVTFDLSDITLPTGLTTWSGSFSLDVGDFFPSGEYLIKLTDGRSGPAILEQTIQSGRPTIVRVRGAGPLSR